MPSVVPGWGQVPRVQGSCFPQLQLSPPLPTRAQTSWAPSPACLCSWWRVPWSVAGRDSALLHGSLLKGMNRTLPLSSRSPQTVGEEFRTEDMPKQS